MEVKLTDNAKKFLVFSYFGITEDELEKDDEDTKEKIAMKCADKAYEDMCRTLTFSEKMDGKYKKEIKGKRQGFRKAICKLIVENVFELLECNEDNFDSWHNTACRKIEKKANEYPGFCEQKLLAKRNKDDKEVFYYGQAQKWLNMTIKYMLMFDCFSKLMNDNDLENKLHVPVDNYVIKAAKGEKLAARIKISPKVWSKWNDEEYKEFQESLSDALGGESPMKWEEKAWIEIAKEERDQENKK